MADIEAIEAARYGKEIDDDLRHIVKKYCRIMGWDVPELVEKAARSVILKAVKDSPSEIEVES